MTKQYNHPMPPLDVAMNRAGQIRRFGDAADGEQKKMVVLADEIERLRSYWTGDKLTGGSDVCHTCQAHCVVIGDKDAEIEALIRERHQLRNELTAARLENERRQHRLQAIALGRSDLDASDAETIKRLVALAAGAAVEPSEVPLPERDPGRVALAIGLLERFRDGRIDSLKSRHESILGCRKQLEEERDIFGYAIEALRTLPAKYGEQA